MARTELPWLLWGRHVRPFALAVSVATACLCGLILTGGSVWGSPVDVWTLLVGMMSGTATIALWVGFWLPSRDWMLHGLMLAGVTFAVRGTWIAAVSGWTTGGLLTAGISFSWVLGSLGAYMLEATTGDRGR